MLTLVRLPGVPTEVSSYDDASCAYLLHSGRWVECFVPTTDGTKHFGAGNLYGYAGASTDTQLRKLNEMLLKYAIARMATFHDSLVSSPPRFAHRLASTFIIPLPLARYAKPPPTCGELPRPA